MRFIETLKTRFMRCALSVALMRFRPPSSWPRVVVYISTGRWQKYWTIPNGFRTRPVSNELSSIRVFTLIPRVQLTLVPFCASRDSDMSKPVALSRRTPDQGSVS